MGRGITVTSGFGWVIDKFDGDYAGNLAQFLDEGTDLDELVKETMKREGLEVARHSFGYEFQSAALLHKASCVRSYDWYHDATVHAPKPGAQDAWRRELLQALDALGWDEAGLGDPTWLLLVLYG